MHSDLLHLQSYHESGDARAFHTLVKHHASMVYATACRVTRDPALAEDVAQETFLELARKGRSVSESVGAWLHRVAWRRACDAVRAEVTRKRYEAAAPTVGDGHECKWEELEPVVDEAISELAVEERVVIIEHFLEGRTQGEIAARMGVSQSTVSRLLDQSLVQLRVRLKNKGLLCGATLGALMMGSSVQAAPAALIASLHKIGLSSIGMGAGSGGLLQSLLGLNVKVMVSCIGLAGVCVISYDLASEDSFLAGLFAGEPQKLPLETSKIRSKKSITGDEKARLLAEAQSFWARRPKLSKEEIQRLVTRIRFEKDAEKRFALMHETGMRLSRATYERILARYPEVHFFDERAASYAGMKMMNELGLAWTMECPREAIVLQTSVLSSTDRWFLPCITPWVRNHPAEWEAFVEAGPDPILGVYAKLWVEEWDHPGTLWQRGKEAGIPLEGIEGHLSSLVLIKGWPTDALFHLMMSCPNAKVRDDCMMGMVLLLSQEQLLEAANSGLFRDAGLVNALRTMGGDTDAEFKVAADWLANEAKGGGMEAQQARWVEEAMGPFYAQWLKVDAKSALQHCLRSQNEILLDLFMKEAAKSTAVDEALILKSLASLKNRDRALAAYYQARAGGDSAMALQVIIHSPYVEDQIQSAQWVVNQWAKKSSPEAAAWVMTLPAGAGREELLALVLSKWAETAPEAAFAFAHQQGLGLVHEWMDGLAWGARGLPDEKLVSMFVALREDPKYNTLLTRLVSVRYPSHPDKAFALLSKHAVPGWQALVIQDVIHWLERDDARAEDYALRIPTLDLSRVEETSVLKAAQLYVLRRVDEGKLPEAFQWTLKLPPRIATDTRERVMDKLTLTDTSQRSAMEQWIRRAPISEDERASLLQSTK